MKLQTIVKTAVLAGVTTLGTGALADGVPRRAVRDFGPPPFTWTGFYVGLNAGAAWADSDISLGGSNTGAYVPGYFSNILASGPGTASDSTFTGGVQAGYNIQTGTLVLGVETDINSFRIRAGRSVSNGAFPANPFTISDTVETDWLYTFRGRIGVTLGSNIMAYVTGGLAVSDLHHGHTYRDSAAPVFAEATGTSSTKVGWTIGGGLEWALDRNWTFKGEYLYVDLGSVDSGGTLINTATGGPAGASFNHSADLTAHIARVGINYKF